MYKVLDNILYLQSAKTSAISHLEGIPELDLERLESSLGKPESFPASSGAG